MTDLTPDEARVLGVLIEKAFTTPDQYPMSLNAVVNGSNQKNNRDPLMQMDESRAFAALEGLREHALVVRSDMVGSRVNKYKHSAGEALHARTAELAILAELMLRGPQTLGELRGRASRMQAFESLDAVKNMLTALATRDVPLAKELPPSPGSRAERYVQLLAPGAHATDAPAESVQTSTGDSQGVAQPVSINSRVSALEAELIVLRNVVRRLAQSLGEPDPFPANIAQGVSAGSSPDASSS